MELYVRVIKPLIGSGYNVTNLEHEIPCCVTGVLG